MHLRYCMWNGKRIVENLVLVVDDELSIREVLSALLCTKGYSVLEAANGQEALEVLEKSANFPRIILLELSMPIMNGRSFLEIRAKNPFLRQIPVVVVSGSPASGEPIKGIAAYLRKPVNFDRLMAAVIVAASG
jgi:CheY-like chemotaxis protein